jgi:hypothetical protein
MSVSDVKEVAEVITVGGTEHLNEYLKAGWVVLAVATMTTDHRDYSEPMIKYSLGWAGTLPAPRPANPRFRAAL